MTKAKYLAVDTETGGLSEDVSLLTAYLAVLDKDLQIIDELDLAIRPDDDVYHVTAEALSINKIDLVKHQAASMSRGKAGELLREFLIRNSANGSYKILPLGHNVKFDLDRLYANVLNHKEAQKYVSYRALDTGAVGEFLKSEGLIPESVSGSLSSYVEHLGVAKREAHTARGDVEMTVDVMKAMKALVRR